MKLLFGMAGKKIGAAVVLVLAFFLFPASGNVPVTNTEAAFLKMTDALRNRGDQYMEQGFPLQANYYYAQAIVAVESFRQALYDIYILRRDEYLLRKKLELEEAIRQAQEEEEEDDDWMDLIVDDGGWLDVISRFEELTEELEVINEQLAPIAARYDSINKAQYEQENNPYDLLAAYSIVSPYPFLFEGLVAERKGNEKKAADCYAAAFFNPELAHDVLNFDFLLTMSSSEMAALHARLEQKEIEYGKFYRPEVIGYPRGALHFSDLYLRDVAVRTLETDSVAYGLALSHYKAARAANPLDGDNFAGCALLSAVIGDSISAANYINEGLQIDPEHKGLQNLLKAWEGGSR